MYNYTRLYIYIYYIILELYCIILYPISRKAIRKNIFMERSLF